MSSEDDPRLCGSALKMASTNSEDKTSSSSAAAGRNNHSHVQLSLQKLSATSTIADNETRITAKGFMAKEAVRIIELSSRKSEENEDQTSGTANAGNKGALETPSKGNTTERAKSLPPESGEGRKVSITKSRKRKTRPSSSSSLMLVSSEQHDKGNRGEVQKSKKEDILRPKSNQRLTPIQTQSPSKLGTESSKKGLPVYGKKGNLSMKSDGKKHNAPIPSKVNDTKTDDPSGQIPTISTWWANAAAASASVGEVSTVDGT